MVLKLYFVVTILCHIVTAHSEKIGLLGTVKIGQQCDKPEDCVGRPGVTSTCASSKCECLDGFITSSSNEDCLEVINQLNQAACTEPQQCRAGVPGPLSECTPRPSGGSTKYCACRDGAVNDDGAHECVARAISVGDPCDFDAQCRHFTSSRCSPAPNRKCVCEDTHIPDGNNKKCIARSYLGDPCDEELQCADIENSSCLPNTGGVGKACTCNVGFIPLQKIECNKLAERLGQTCEKQDLQCKDLTDAVCVSIGTSKICRCPDTHAPNLDSTGCILKNPLNDSCSDTKLCTVTYSQCLDSKCVCKKDEYVESWEAVGTCVKIITEENRPCAEDVQCIQSMGTLSSCRDNICQCKVGYKFYLGKCYFPATLNALCQQDKECVVGVNNYTFCATQQPRKCRCTDGAKTFDNSCYGTKRIGDPCINDAECRVPLGQNAHCDSGLQVCSCNYGFNGQVGAEFCSSGAQGVPQMPSVALILGYVMYYFAKV